MAGNGVRSARPRPCAHSHAHLVRRLAVCISCNCGEVQAGQAFGARAGAPPCTGKYPQYTCPHGATATPTTSTSGLPEEPSDRRPCCCALCCMFYFCCAPCAFCYFARVSWASCFVFLIFVFVAAIYARLYIVNCALLRWELADGGIPCAPQPLRVRVQSQWVSRPRLSAVQPYWASPSGLWLFSWVPWVVCKSEEQGRAFSQRPRRERSRSIKQVSTC